MNFNKNKNWLLKEYNRLFIYWLREYIFVKMNESSDSVIERVRWLLKDLILYVFYYNDYFINDYIFYIKV